jgi:hypothetical protein
MARKSMEKITDPNIFPKKLAIPRAWDMGVSPTSWAFKAALREWRELMIEALWEYLENHDQLLIEDFLLHYRIPRSTFTDMRNNYPDIGAAVDEVKVFIAAKRRNGNYRRILSDRVYSDMFTYDPEWQKIEDHQDNREIRKSVEIKKQDDQDKNGTIIVQMTKFTEEK